MTKSAESGEVASISAISLSITSNAYADDDGHYKSREEAGGVEGAKVHGGSEELWEEVHEFFAWLLMVLVFVHVAAVLLTWFVYGENLIRAMITGNRVTREHA
jgi:cytochrome b